MPPPDCLVSEPIGYTEISSERAKGRGSDPVSRALEALGWGSQTVVPASMLRMYPPHERLEYAIWTMMVEMV